MKSLTHSLLQTINSNIVSEQIQPDLKHLKKIRVKMAENIEKLTFKETFLLELSENTAML